MLRSFLNCKIHLGVRSINPFFSYLKSQALFGGPTARKTQGGNIHRTRTGGQHLNCRKSATPFDLSPPFRKSLRFFSTGGLRQFPGRKAEICCRYGSTHTVVAFVSLMLPYLISAFRSGNKIYLSLWQLNFAFQAHCQNFGGKS